MNKLFTLEEVIYDFLDSVNNIKDLFVLKGCYALKYHIKDLNKFRNTKDIDFHCFSKNDWITFIESFETIASSNSKLGLKYVLVKRRGFDKNPNSDRLTINVEKNIEVIETFTIDMNIGGIVDFDVLDNGLRYYSLASILADKLHVLQSIKIFRRIKDFIDIYCIATSFDFNGRYLCSTIKDRFRYTGREFVPSNDLFYNNKENIAMMRHAYEKYSGDIKFRIDFNQALGVVKSFSDYLLECCREDSFYVKCDWNKSSKLWLEGSFDID